MTECITNPLFLFLAVWGTAVALYLAGVFAGTFPSPRALTVGALLLNAVGFSLGYLTWTVFKCLTPPALEPPRALHARLLTRQRMQRALTFTWLMGVIALLLILYRVAVLAARFNTGFLDLLTQPALLRLRLITSLEMSSARTSLMTMLISPTSGLFAVGFVLLGVFLRLDGTRRKYVYLCSFLLVGFATCLTNLSRYDMTVSVLYLILAYCITSSLSRRERRRRVAGNLLLPVFVVVMMFVVVELLLRKGTAYGQASRFQGILFSLYWYLASPLAAFNEFLAGFHGPWELGQNTFLPFYKWLHLFHLLPAPDMPLYTEWVFVPHGTNVYTYLRNFYEDFGLLGVVVLPYAFGWLTAALQGPPSRWFPFLNLYVVLLAPIAFSFYSYPLLSSQFYLQILFGFTLFRYDLRDLGEPGLSG